MRITIIIILSMVSTALISQDWAYLEKYREDNANLLSSNSKSIEVVFMGNSITESWTHMRPDFFLDNSFVGRGIGGQTTPQMLIRMRPDVIDLNPKAVVILAGVNDIAGNTGPMALDEILGNIKSMAELAEANGIKVILCSILPAYDFPWRAGMEPNIKIPKLNKMIAAYAVERGFHYLDYFSVMADDRNGLPKKYAEDEVHPTHLGYSVMEPLVLLAISEVLADN